jgi:glutamine amidotransferase
MKFALLPHILPELAQQIRGTTDSEWVYALLLSQLRDPFADLAAQDIVAAISKTFGVLAQVRRELGIHTFSPMNLFLSDGNDIVCACYTFDLHDYDGLGEHFNPPEEQALRIWYTTGRSYGFHGGEWKMLGPSGEARSTIIASEPLTRDRSSWTAVPMQHVVYVRRTAETPSIEVTPLHLG